MPANHNARDIFLAALDRAPADRVAYLDEACGDDAAVRQRVEALLRAHDEPGAFLSEAKPGVGDVSPLPPAEAGDGTSAHVPNRLPQTEEDSDPTTRVGALLAGKYKLIEEIGEGGMGSVYLAQQTEPVKRAVAVKVIKAGMDSRAVLVRFEAERQALALMDHPNIARVLDAGTTAGGRPFFVMELVKGTPITQFCDERKLPPRQRLELFVPVCQAIQHAHQKGIIHRDLKPSNVLVALYDDRPVPKVIDFGVAKAAGQTLTDKTLMTGFGAVVGTPEYMSPEQASLNNLDIDTRSDVYSLGVLLYELLTGTTPVDRKSLGQAALLEILRIVREVEAPRPSAKLSSSDALPSVAANRGTEPARLAKLMKGELDWVLLKALEKDRARRYDTANALSRDIQRYLADEVVEARPPSAGYRLKKFVRRHKGQVLAASLVLVALVAGMAGTTWGLLEARTNEAAAVVARNDAVAARNDLASKNLELEHSQAVVVKQNTELEQSQSVAVKQNTELNQKQDQLEGALARTWLSPLSEAPGPLTDAEIGAFTELSSVGNERLAERFVTEALRNCRGMRKLRARSAFALHAVVGLDARKRQEVERHLVRALARPDLPEESRTDLALAASALGELPSPAAAVVAQTLLQALARARDFNTGQSLAQDLSAVATRMEPKEAVATLTQANAEFVPFTRRLLAPGLSAVLARMQPREAAATLTHAITRTNDSDALVFLAQGLSAAADRLEPKEAARASADAAATLTQAMTRTNDPYALEYSAQLLSAVAARMEPREAARVCAEAAATFTQAMTRTNDPRALAPLAQGLSAVAARLEPREVARVSAEATAMLTQGMTKTNDPYALASLAQGLSAVAARLEPKEAAALFTQAMTKTNHPSTLGYLVQGLSTAVARMESKEAARVSAQAAATLTQAMTKTNDPYALASLAQGLSAVAARLEPREVARASAEAAAMLTQGMTKTNDPDALVYLARGLSAVANGLEPKEAADTLTQAMTRTNNVYPLGYLAQGLSAVAARLEPKEAVALFTQAMTKTYHPSTLGDLAPGLSAVAARLQPKQAAEAAVTLMQAMTRANNEPIISYERRVLNNVEHRPEMVDPFTLGYLAQGLAAVANRMEPREAARVHAMAAAMLTDAMTKPFNSYALAPLAQGLAAVAARLEPREAARVSAQAAATLTHALTRLNAPLSLAEGLAAVAARLEPREAAQAATAITQAMTRTNDPYDLKCLAEGLAAVAARMDAREAARLSAAAAATLMDALAKTSDPDALKQSLSAVLGEDRRLERARAVAATVGYLHDRQGLPGAVALLRPAGEPFPRRLSDQELVDLLKRPLCVGPARRAVLDRLEDYYQRPFAERWDFVRFAEEQKLGLDFTSPPPEQKIGNAQAAAEEEIAAGRIQNAIVHLVTLSATDPEDTILSMKVAALQAWFGQDKDLADTCARALEFAKVKSDPMTVERMAKICSLHPTQDKTRLEAALALARKAVEFGKADPLLPWFQLTLGMAEYRSGHFAAADAALIAAANGGKDNALVAGTSALYRAMSLFRQGKPDEARKQATEAAATMRPLPADEKNPVAGGADHDDLILWLAYKEAKALIQYDAAPLPEKK